VTANLKGRTADPKEQVALEEIDRALEDVQPAHGREVELEFDTLQAGQEQGQGEDEEIEMEEVQTDTHLDDEGDTEFEEVPGPEDGDPLGDFAIDNDALLATFEDDGSPL